MMKMVNVLTGVFVTTAVLAVGCHGASSAGEAASISTTAAATPTAATPPKSGSSQETKIDKLGLKADLPEMSQVGDGIAAGSVMVMGTAPVNIAVAKPDDPKTVDAAKKEASMFKPTDFKDSKLNDGWSLTYENTGSMGTNYWLVVRRDIGGKTYRCDTSVSSDDQRAAALKICLSLRQ
jgi:hypothetical protein